MINRFRDGEKKVNEFLNKHSKSRPFLILSSLLTCFILTLVASYAGVFIHELGHSIVTVIIFPNAGSAIYLLEGFEMSYPFPVQAWQIILISEGGSISSFIALNLVGFVIIPRLKPARHVLKLTLLLFCVVCIWNSTLYHALVLFQNSGDTRTVVNVLNWWWGLSSVQGDAPFDSGIILTIIGLALSVLYIFLIYRKFRIEVIAFLGERFQNSGKRFRKYSPIVFYGAMYPVYYFLYSWFSLFLAIEHVYGNYVIDVWTMGYGWLIIAMLMGLAFFGIIGLIAVLNKVFVSRNDPSQYRLNIKLESVFILASFFVFMFPIIIVHNYNQGRSYVEFQEGFMVRITYGVSLYEETQVGIFSTPNGVFEVFNFQNITRQGVFFNGFCLNLAETPESKNNKTIFLQNSTSIDGLSDNQIAPILLPNLSLWIFSGARAVKGNGIDEIITIVVKVYDLSGIVYGSAPSALAMKSEFTIPSNRMVLSNDASTLRAAYDNSSNLIWLFANNSTRNCSLILINPSTRTLSSTRTMNATIFNQGHVFFRNGAAFCTYNVQTRWWVLSSLDNGASWSAPIPIYTCRADESISSVAQVNDLVLFGSIFNHDLWITTFSIPANFSIVQDRIRVTRSYEDEWINYIIQQNGHYYLSCGNYDAYSNIAMTLYESSALQTWTLIA